MNKILLFLSFLFPSVLGYGQPSAFYLHELDLPGVLKDQIIGDVAIDNAGLLWLITNNGLYRYDGSSALHLNQHSVPAIPHSSLNVLLADRQDNLWIGAKDGLTRLNLKTWTTSEIRAPAGSPIQSRFIRTIVQGDKGVIYAGSQDGKVYRVVGDSLQVLLDVGKEFSGKESTPFITFIKEPYPNQLWVGTAVGKLIRIRVNKDGSYAKPEYFGPDSLANSQLIECAFGRSGQCLVAVPGHGLYRFNTQTGEWRHVPGEVGAIGRDGQAFIHPLNRDEILITTNAPEVSRDQIFMYHFSTDSFTQRQLQFPDYLKKNHYVWLKNTGSQMLISLNGHLMELDDNKSPFTTLLSDAKALNSIRSIYKSPIGSLYIGSYRDGFVRMDEKTNTQKIIARKYVYCMLPWNKDSLLLGTEGSGLYWYEPAYDRLSPLETQPASPKERPLREYITSLTRENDHEVIVGTYQGAFVLNPYTKTIRTIGSDKLSRTKIYDVLNNDGQYLMATQFGIWKWLPQEDALTDCRLTGSADAGRRQAVYGMIAVGNRIWAATNGQGILEMDRHGQIVDSINQATGLSGNVVFSLIDAGKFVVAGTHNGLSLINKMTGKITNYSQLNGLPVNECNSGAVFKSGDTVYLGTINGIVRFVAAQIPANQNHQLHIPLYVTELTTAGKSGERTRNYTLPYHKDSAMVIPAGIGSFSVTFGGFRGSRRDLKYFYRLEKSSNWIPAGASQKITFAGVSPGNYQFQIKAKLPDGQWTAVLFEAPLIVTPAFYQTIWFMVLIMILLGVLVWAWFKYRERQKEKERLLRLQIAGDLHDEVGSTLSGIAMQADMLLTGRHEFLKDYLTNIAVGSRAAVHTMGDIVWSIDPRNDDSMSLLQRMKRYGNTLLEPADISIVFSAGENLKLRHVPQKYRQNAMLIFKEALTNVVKHAEATEVKVSLVMRPHTVKMIIADDGIGMQEEAGKGHGLRNMKMRAETIGARLYFPKVEKGMTIVLELKV